MTSNWLLVAEAASLRLPSDGLFLRAVELAATYLVQSTLFVVGGWALLPVLSSLARTKQKTKPDGQECPSYGVSPAMTERLWKLAAVLALVTAPMSVFTGWSRPAWEWSLRERPSAVNAVVSLEASRPERIAMTEPLAPAAIGSRPALPEELAALDNEPPADRLMADEPTAELLPFAAATLSPNNTLDQRTDTEHVVIEPTVIPLSLVEVLGDLHTPRRDSHPAPAPNQLAEVEPRHTSIHWLGMVLVAWVVWSALRLVAKGFALRCRLAGCEPIVGVLRQELNRLTPRGRTVRLLRSSAVRLLHSGPLAPGPMGERARGLLKILCRVGQARFERRPTIFVRFVSWWAGAAKRRWSHPTSLFQQASRVRGPNGDDALPVTDGSVLSRSDEKLTDAVTKTEEPLTLTLSPPRRGARGQDAALSRPPKRRCPRRGVRGQDSIIEPNGTITEPFACGLFRWTIVLPAGIEQQLSSAEMKALLAHEVAHLVRRDPWWLWLGEVLCTCLAFQPLNFLARWHWQQAAELLCDDWAVERKVSASSLASCLTRIAEWRLDRRAALMGLTAVGHSGSLTHRIEWLLRTGRATEPKRPRGRMLATLLTFSAGLLVGTYGPRLSFVLPAEAGDELEAVAVLNESDLWNDIDRDLVETLSELARLDLPLSNAPDPAVASLANSLRERAAALSEQLAQPVTAASHAERGHK